jgi:membrane protein YqaA with SNARE-associated domain
MSESSSQVMAADTKKPNIFKRMYLWVLHWAETPYGTPALFGLSFAESSFFPIPPDVLQIALSISKPKRSFYYATVSMIASVLGAILGWYIGYALWVGGLEYFFLNYVPGVDEEIIAKVQGLYAAYGFMIIAVAAFTPIPYKVFTITAGMGGTISLPVLLVASVIGRSARFYLVATCIFFFGPTVKRYIDEYFELATIVFTILLIGGFVLIKFVLH